MNDRHVIVVGGGPAGSSAAIGFLRNNARVTVFEQRELWNGRVCGSFLNPEAVHHLKWLGVFDEAIKAGGVFVKSTNVTVPNGTARQVRTVQREEISMGLPRKELETILLRRVDEEGGAVRMNCRVVSVVKERNHFLVNTRSFGEVAHQSHRADHVVFADGRFTASIMPEEKKTTGWYGWNAPFTGIAQNPGEQSLHFVRGGYVGILTFHDNTSNVCGLIRRINGASLVWENIFANLTERQPSLHKLLRNANRVGEWKGVGPLPFSTRMRHHDEFLLVGDAAAVGDPFMGEGIGRALGAGPMITKLLKTVSITSPQLVLEYEKLWNTTYASRLRLGRWARAALANPLTFTPLTILLRHSNVLDKVTPQFHVGWARHLDI